MKSTLVSGRVEWVRFTSRKTATQTRVPNTCRAASDWRQRLDYLFLSISSDRLISPDFRSRRRKHGTRAWVAMGDVCAVDGEACRKLAKGSCPHWSQRDARIYFFPFTEFDGESLWVVSREGGDESKIVDLRPLHPIGNFFDVSPQDQIVWVRYRQSKHELWLADLSDR